MKKQNRILKNDQYLLLIKKGKRINSANISTCYLPNSENNFRIGISVSKKVSKLAVRRNKLKRQITAILQTVYNQNNKFDIIFILKPTSIQLGFNELKNEIESILTKIN